MNKALFLDRDGVINQDLGHVYRPEDVVFIDGIFDLCHAAQSQGFRLIVITNQAGVAKGYYSEEQVRELHCWMETQFLQRGIRIDAFYYCPYHPLGTVKEYCRSSYDRKPLPGMLLKAEKDLNIDMGQSILIGDKASDIEAALAAGIKDRILLAANSDDPSQATHTISKLDQIRTMFLTK